MHCHVCNVAVGEGQQFCHECGESLDGVTDPTGPMEALTDAAPADDADDIADDNDDEIDVDDDADDVDDDATVERVPLLASEQVTAPPVPETGARQAHRGALPDLAAPVDDAWWDGKGEVGPMPQPPTESIDAVTDAPDAPLAPAEPIEVFEAPIVPDAIDDLAITPIVEEPLKVEPLEASPAFDATTTMPAVATGSGGDMEITDEFESGGLFDGAADVATYPETEPHGFKLRAAFVLSVLALVATLMANVAEIVEIRTSRPVDGIKVGFTMLDDVGTNLGIAGLVGVGLMLIGGFASCFGLRWGAGLAGGSGLALIGWAAISLGLMENRINDAQLVTRASGADVNGFTLFITRDLGWFLIAAIAAIGVIVFVVSLRMAGTGGQPGLNPWIAAVGALTMVIVAAGPLIPLGGAPFDVNFGTGTTPSEFFAARLIQLALIMVTGVVGFLSVRTYGLGFAAGGLGVSTWLWITALVDGGAVTGDAQVPVSIAVGNVGTFSTVPHAVTTVGMTASLALLLVAATIAAVSHVRR